MDYRQYDSAIGRFYSPDVLSELSHSITPYRFAYNNPIFFSDPTGLYEVDGNGNINITDKKEIKMFTEYLKNNQKASVSEMSEHHKREQRKQVKRTKNRAIARFFYEYN